VPYLWEENQTMSDATYDYICQVAAEFEENRVKMAKEIIRLRFELSQSEVRRDELSREVEQWQADRNVLQGQIERLTKSQVVMAQHLHETQTALVCAEAAIRAMWQVFASALAYSEHGRSSELNGLRKLAEEFRTNPPTGIMDIILGAVDNEQAQR
jgi:septal ring factor EnvC (AmiA/AmiB activator)